MATALAGPSSTLVVVLTPIGSVVAALITGFGAAVAKHRWDTKADERRWRKERGARDRALLLEAFADYLAARPNEAAGQAVVANQTSLAAVVSTVQLAAARLLILLPGPDQRDIVAKDRDQMVDWAVEWARPSSARRKRAPSPDRVLDLARALVTEGGEADSGR
jgi:hypothetical protein